MLSSLLVVTRFHAATSSWLISTFREMMEQRMLSAIMSLDSNMASSFHQLIAYWDMTGAMTMIIPRETNRSAIRSYKLSPINTRKNGSILTNGRGGC